MAGQKRSSSTGSRSARAISSSLPTRSASTASASTTRGAHSPRSWSTSRLPYDSPLYSLNGQEVVHQLTATGRERISPRRHPLQARLLPRTDHRPRGIHPQALRAAVHHLAQPEVLPHAREPQLQHCQEHREAHLQLQPYGGGVDARHGRAAGRRCALLLPGREERYFINLPLSTHVRLCGRMGGC